MPRTFNPENGFICTANEDLNYLGNASPINMPMGSYRSDRIAELLNNDNRLDVKAMCRMHFDVHSKQAELFMPIIKPLLKENAVGQILTTWDCRYNKESKGAYLFECFYKELYQLVFGINGFGKLVCEYLQNDSGAFIDFYANFDQVLLSKESPWHRESTQEEIFSSALSKISNIQIKEWQDVQSYTMKNILFDGKLPNFLGFDKGPIAAIGGRATIHQGQIYRAGNRDTTFLPSYRMVTDFSEQTIHTNLAGGPSDRRYSKWYTSDLDNWISGIYKEVSIPKIGKKLNFP